METYLAGEDVTAEQIASVVAKAMVAGTVVPVFFTVAKQSIGVPELADAIARYFPSPADMPARKLRVAEAADAEAAAVKCDASLPFVGQAFRIAADPFVGKLSWIRILQGSVAPETTFVVRDERKGGKVGHIFKLQGKETVEVSAAVAGDIIALAKIEDVKAGDILHHDPKPLFGPLLPVPTPMYSLAVTPKTRGDETKISEALARLTE
jgi:elongation factor G